FGAHQEKTGDSRCEIDSMSISERLCHSSNTSGWSLTKEKTSKLVRPTLTISGCRTSNVFPLAIWIRNGRNGSAWTYVRTEAGVIMGSIYQESTETGRRRRSLTLWA